MTKNPRKSGHNVVSLPAKPSNSRDSASDTASKTTGAGTLAGAGSSDDPRMQEALRLMGAFLAIEDDQGRAALITLAERLVSFEWIRKAQQR